MTAQVCGAAAATHCAPTYVRAPKGGEKRQGGEGLVVVLIATSTAAMWLYGAQLSQRGGLLCAG